MTIDSSISAAHWRQCRLRSYADSERPDERKEVVVKLRLYDSHHMRNCSLTMMTVSQDPGNYEDAPTEGIRRVLEIVTGESYSREKKLPIEKIGSYQNSS